LETSVTLLSQSSTNSKEPQKVLEGKEEPQATKEDLPWPRSGSSPMKMLITPALPSCPTWIRKGEMVHQPHPEGGISQSLGPPQLLPGLQLIVVQKKSAREAPARDDCSNGGLDSRIQGKDSKGEPGLRLLQAWTDREQE
jgi:hypothetical protein